MTVQRAYGHINPRAHAGQNNECIDEDSPALYDASFDELMDQDLEQLPNAQDEQTIISFQGVHFDIKMSKTTPIEVTRGEGLPHFDRLTSFLKTLE